MAKRVPKFSVGQRVWFFDLDYRVYPKDSGACSGPIHAEHFRPRWILGIVGRSYMVGTYEGTTTGIKVSIDKAESRFMDDAGRDDFEWQDYHGHRVADAVRYCSDTAVLKQIAALVGYEAKEKR